MLYPAISGLFVSGLFCGAGGVVGLIVGTSGGGSATWVNFAGGAATASVFPGGVGVIATLLLVLCGGLSLRWSREMIGFSLGAVIAASLAWGLKFQLSIQPEAVIAAVPSVQPLVATIAPAIIEGRGIMDAIGIIVSGGILLWALFGIAAIAVSWLADENKPMPATVVAIVSVVVLCWMGGINPLTWAQANPLMATITIPAYLAIGTLWCMGKWYYSYLPDIRRRVDTVTVEFQRKHEVAISAAAAEIVSANQDIEDAGHRLEALGESRDTRSSSSHWSPNLAAVKSDLSRSEERLKRARDISIQEPSQAAWLNDLKAAGIDYPAVKKVSSNKTRIIAWMAYWPASMAWTVLNDPVRRAFVGIYNAIGGRLQKMADQRFAGVDDAWKSAPPTDLKNS